MLKVRTAPGRPADARPRALEGVEVPNVARVRITKALTGELKGLFPPPRAHKTASADQDATDSDDRTVPTHTRRRTKLVNWRDMLQRAKAASWPPS